MIGVSTALVSTVGALALVLMLVVAATAPRELRPEMRIEAIKYGLGAIAGSGAVAALLLAIRRQHLSERAYEHTERVQRHAEHDAAERQVTDVYTKAVDQIGAPDAAVRLGGLYALERVAEGSPRHRQRIVDVLCAYLAMPFEPPPVEGVAAAPPASGLAAAADPPVVRRDPVQELRVRLAAQRILTKHLTAPAAPSFWSDIDLDLSGAVLVHWSLRDGRVRDARFAKATFHGTAEFAGTTVEGVAVFDDARFGGDADFAGVRLDGATSFTAARCAGAAAFTGARMARAASFEGVTVAGTAGFADARFAADVVFDHAELAVAEFGDARFGGRGSFRHGSFGAVTFRGAHWDGAACFVNRTFAGAAEFTAATFAGADFGRAHFGAEAVFDAVDFEGGAGFVAAGFAGDLRFAAARFGGRAGFERADFAGDVHLDGATARVGGGIDHVLPPGWRLATEAPVLHRADIVRDPG
jgi:uncharacterized protein YjbI with pentapeptide repeats